MASGTLNARIVRIRKREGICARTLARRLGMPRNEYLVWESDTHQLTVHQAFRIADALNVPMSDLVGSDGAAEASLRKSILKICKLVLAADEIAKGNVKGYCARIKAECLHAMPELADAKPWTLGHRREPHEPSKIELTQLPADIFIEQPYANAM